jgi:hypothetical protein
MKRGTTQGKAQAPGRSLDPVIRLHNPPSEKALMSMWFRLNKWCDYHKIETVIVEGGFEWECQIGYVKSRSPSLLRAIAETHRKVQSIHRHQQKPNPAVRGDRKAGVPCTGVVGRPDDLTKNGQ